MIKMMDVRKVKTNVTGTKFILDGSELISYLSPSLTINELGKQLLKAATEGNVEEIRALMSKGAPFTADWLGTSPLHLAAQNNHLEICEILLRAGMSRDARTKVDRTPLHMAAYEGHIEIVECLLKNGADYDVKDLLHMTPLHWAAQNGHAEVASNLIRYGAATQVTNKFDLTPIDIAMQISRPDIVQIINMSIRDPLVATQHLALELISENSTESAIEPILNLCEDNNEVEEELESPNIPLETIMIEEDEDNTMEPEHANMVEQQEGEFITGDNVEIIEPESNNTFSESIRLLQQHGITMLPVDDNNILNSVMENGHSVVLTEAGKQALNSIKTTENNQDISEYLKPKSVMGPVKKKKIITVTPEQFLAMTSSNQGNILKLVNNGKIVNNVPKPTQVKRIVMKKNKIVPIAQSNVKVSNVESEHDVESLLDQLQKAHTLIESYKRKLLKSEVEVARYKQQLKILLEQSKLASSS